MHSGWLFGLSRCGEELCLLDVPLLCSAPTDGADAPVDRQLLSLSCT
jgi:hypothetical protein